MFTVLWLVVGLLDFGWLAQVLATSLPDDLAFASLLLSIGFAVSTLIVVAGIVGWQRAHAEAISDLGWRRPTTRTALVLGVLFGIAWAALSYARGGNPATWTWERLPMALIGIFLAFGEELAVRGFVLEHLRRGGVPTWIQVIVSAIGMGTYHGLLGWHYSVLYALSSAVLLLMDPVVFGRLTRNRGWTPERFERWFTDSIPRLLLPLPEGGTER